MDKNNLNRSEQSKSQSNGTKTQTINQANNQSGVVPTSNQSTTQQIRNPPSTNQVSNNPQESSGNPSSQPPSQPSSPIKPGKRKIKTDLTVMVVGNIFLFCL